MLQALSRVLTVSTFLHGHSVSRSCASTPSVPGNGSRNETFAAHYPAKRRGIGFIDFRRGRTSSRLLLALYFPLWLAKVL